MAFPAKDRLLLIRPWQILACAAFISLTIGLGYFVGQSDFRPLIVMYGSFFALYIAIFLWAPERDVLFFVGVGAALRFLLLFSFPNLSDDVYRFIWDGRLIVNGYNPFDHLPSHYLEEGNAVPGLDRQLYEELNSQGYFTVYPPVAQAVFALSCFLFPGSLGWSVLVMKAIMVAFELGSLRLLWLLLGRLELPRRNVLLYALNPLIILEITGNLHFEGAMIFFLLLSFWWLLQGRRPGSALMAALSVASKLLSLIFLPFLIKRLGLRGSVRYFAVTGAFLVVLFLPLFSAAFFGNFGESLDLYFRKFEFNASLYYLLRWVGYQQVGYNLIAKFGPALAVAAGTGIMLLVLLDKSKDWVSLPRQMMFAVFIYLACATTVHPWYVSLPLVMCLFTRYRFPVIWSGMIFLTYINYSFPEYREHLGMVALEYFAVYGAAVYEISSGKSAITT